MKNKKMWMLLGSIVGVATIATSIAVPLALKNDSSDSDSNGIVEEPPAIPSRDIVLDSNLDVVENVVETTFSEDTPILKGGIAKIDVDTIKNILPDDILSTVIASNPISGEDITVEDLIDTVFSEGVVNLPLRDTNLGDLINDVLRLVNSIAPDLIGISSISFDEIYADISILENVEIDSVSYKPMFIGTAIYDVEVENSRDNTTISFDKWSRSNLMLVNDDLNGNRADIEYNGGSISYVDETISNFDNKEYREGDSVTNSDITTFYDVETIRIFNSFHSNYNFTDQNNPENNVENLYSFETKLHFNHYLNDTDLSNGVDPVRNTIMNYNGEYGNESNSVSSITYDFLSNITDTLSISFSDTRIEILN